MAFLVTGVRMHLQEEKDSEAWTHEAIITFPWVFFVVDVVLLSQRLPAVSAINWRTVHQMPCQ